MCLPSHPAPKPAVFFQEAPSRDQCNFPPYQVPCWLLESNLSVSTMHLLMAALPLEGGRCGQSVYPTCGSCLVPTLQAQWLASPPRCLFRSYHRCQAIHSWHSVLSWVVQKSPAQDKLGFSTKTGMENPDVWEA